MNKKQIMKKVKTKLAKESFVQQCYEVDVCPKCGTDLSCLTLGKAPWRYTTFLCSNCDATKMAEMILRDKQRTVMRNKPRKKWWQIW